MNYGLIDPIKFEDNETKLDARLFYLSFLDIAGICNRIFNFLLIL